MNENMESIFQEVENFIETHTEAEDVFFQIDNPEWDAQKLNFTIDIVAEYDFGDIDFEIYNLLSEEELKEKISFLQKKYGLKFYQWEMRRFEYFNLD